MSAGIGRLHERGRRGVKLADQLRHLSKISIIDSARVDHLARDE